MSFRPEPGGDRVIETDDFVLFWNPPCPFSQWTPSRFVVEGEAFGCAEQFMMAAKARLFGDEATRARILAATEPGEQKALGREVSGFDQATWERERFGIVVRGNEAKFAQNPAMLAALLATGERRLVEASPYDRIWGIGLGATDPRALDPAEWRGLNLLGQALEEVRRRLRVS